MTHYRLEELKEYLHITETYLKKALVDFKARSDEKVKELQPDERDVYYDYYQDLYWRYEEKFPRILRNSFLVAAYSLLEYEMSLICNRLKDERQIPISFSDLKGDLLDRTKSYCKLASLALPYNDPIWQEIKNYSKVRNCIAHTNGLLKEFQDKKDLIPYLTKKGIISQDTIEEEIALTAPFCEEVIKTMQDFLNKVYEAILTTKKKIRN